MFVGIEDYKGAIAVENILTPYKKGRLAPDKKTRLPKEPITPEVCMEVLRSTNYARNIKDMLECIADLPKAQQTQFKDVVLATFSNREQPSDVLFLGKKLAYVSGYTKEFYAVKELKAGDFIASAVKPAKSYLHLKGLGHLPEDLSEYEELVCRGGSPEFAYVKKMPKTLKFENCMTTRLDANALEPLYLPQWSNALSSAENKERDVCAVGAYDGDTLVGLAGCSADCDHMYQIGVDVLPKYRAQGIAAAVTSRLAYEVFKLGKIPFYCAAWSNIISVKNALKCGFKPAWTELTARKIEYVNEQNKNRR